jgi:hypothetical protein
MDRATIRRHHHTAVAIAVGLLFSGLTAAGGEPGLRIQAQQLVERLAKAPAPQRDSLVSAQSTWPPEAYLFVIDACHDLPGWKDEAFRASMEKSIRPLADAWKGEWEKRKKALDAWTLKTSLDAYNTCGHRNPAWDDDARQALTLLSNRSSINRSLIAEFYRRAQRAIDAGCKDPLILYFRARYAADADDADASTVANGYRDAARLIVDTEYPMIRKVYAIARGPSALLADFRPDSKTRETCRMWLEVAASRLVDAIKTDAPPASEVFFLAELLMDGYARGGGSRSKIHEIIQSALSPDSALAMTIRGHYLWRRALYDQEDNTGDMRGGPTGDPVQQARECLEHAWETDPSLVEACKSMIAIPNGVPGDIKERWFRRGRAADPDDKSICITMMQSLQGGRRGPADDVLTLCRALMAEGNWRARVPFALLEAHAQFGPLRGETHFLDPVVWNDLNRLFDGYLRAFPDDDHERTVYAWWACRCRQWEAANRQFERLGDKAVIHFFKSKDKLDRLRATARVMSGPAGPVLSRAADLRGRQSHEEAIAALDALLKGPVLFPEARRIAASERWAAVVCRDVRRGTWVDLMPPPDPAFPAACSPPPGTEVLGGTWVWTGEAIEMTGDAGVSALRFAPEISDFEMTGEMQSSDGKPRSNCAVLFGVVDPFSARYNVDGAIFRHEQIDSRQYQFLAAQVFDQGRSWVLCDTFFNPQEKGAQPRSGFLPFRLRCWKGDVELYTGTTQMLQRKMNVPLAQIGLGCKSNIAGAKASFRGLRLRRLTEPPGPVTASPPASKD